MKTKLYNEQKNLVASPAEPCLLLPCRPSPLAPIKELNKVKRPAPAFHPLPRGGFSRLGYLGRSPDFSKLLALGPWVFVNIQLRTEEAPR